MLHISLVCKPSGSGWTAVMNERSGAQRARLVRGAARGIGRAIFEKPAAQNRPTDGVARWRADGAFPGEAFVADLRDEQSVKRALANIVSRYEVPTLVNNTGLDHIQRPGEIALAKSDEVTAVNLRAAIQCAQAVLPALLCGRFGVSSTSPVGPCWGAPRRHRAGPWCNEAQMPATKSSFVAEAQTT